VARLSGAANLGWIRPPLVYACAIVLGLLLQAARPVAFMPPGAGAPLGIAAIVAAAALFFFAVRTMRAARTPVPGNLPTTAIVRSGPFRFSRNPIYLAFSLLHLGIACWADSLWLLITLAPATALMAFVVVPREERYLESRFASEYLAYKAAVRRWL
jgi:protein-S-isoprenylcysteine O-methyltransferase Ste14